MADHSRSPSQYFCVMFGIGGFHKAYRSLITSKRHHEKKPNKDQTYKASNDQIQQKGSNNGIHRQENDPPSPKGLFKNHSYTSIPSPLSRSPSPLSPSRNPSLSRSASRCSQTLTPSTTFGRLSRSPRREKTDPSQGRSKSRGSLPRSLSSQGSAVPIGSLSRSSSQKGSTPIMYSNSNGIVKLPETEKKLECTLEELCFGCTKRIMITRDVVANNGQIIEEKEKLTIKVKPGWRNGTKITFDGMGNETPGAYPSDIIFVVTEKKHPLFRREGEDLKLVKKIPLVKALAGWTLSVPLLGGDKMSLEIDEIIQPGFEKVIQGQGMPKLKDHGKRGDLRIEFQVEFPIELGEEQRADVFRILRDSC